MGKQVGPNYITGTFAGVSFYVSEGQYLVRMAGGPTKKQIVSSPRFARTRENISEFGRCSKAGALLRKTLRFVLPGSDKYAYQRLTKLLTEVKNIDTQSSRGQRNVGLALKHRTARNLLCGFEFNARQRLGDLFLKPVYINSEKEICVADFHPGRDLVFPPGATHAILKGAGMLMDFETGQAQIAPYEEIRIDRNGGSRQLYLRPLHTIKGSGNALYFLQLGFCNVDNGIEVPVNANGDALCLVAVNPVLIKKTRRVIRPRPLKITRAQLRNRLVKPVTDKGIITKRLNICTDDG